MILFKQVFFFNRRGFLYPTSVFLLNVMLRKQKRKKEREKNSAHEISVCITWSCQIVLPWIYVDIELVLTCLKFHPHSSSITVCNSAAAKAQEYTNKCRHHHLTFNPVPIWILGRSMQRYHLWHAVVGFCLPCYSCVWRTAAGHTDCITTGPHQILSF